MSDQLKGPENKGAPRPCNVHVILKKENGEQLAEVRVHSLRKPDLHLMMTIERKGTDKTMRRLCGISAGAMAEKLCDDYNDNLDPDEVAKLAGLAYQECADAVRRGKI